MFLLKLSPIKISSVMTIGYIIFIHSIPIAYTKEFQVSSSLYEINLSLANKEKELSIYLSAS